MARGLNVKKLAMIGCGSMGGGMALLFTEHGIEVGLRDPDSSVMDKVVDQAKEIGGVCKRFDDDESLCKWLDDTKIIFWSLPHGTVGDTVLKGLFPYLKKDDIIVDAANEHWENTQRRMGLCVVRGIRYVGMGVSGGYQAARRGPSMCPAADDETLDMILPLLEQVAAKDKNGKPCVAKAGTGGAGHYVKMIHNGIEHGMMSAISEAWAIMAKGLGMNLEEIADELERWNSAGELKDTFLVRIGVDICRTKDPKTGEPILPQVEDKVVQDVTGEEGTGVWSNAEAIAEHIPGPTLAVAHFLRLASSDLKQRRQIKKVFGKDYPPQAIEPKDKQNFLEKLRLATYAACLASYVQGMIIIAKADEEKKFNINYANVLQIWHAGCIIASDYISMELLHPIYDDWESKKDINPLYERKVAEEFEKAFPALKEVVVEATRADHVIPALSASLEYLKIQTSTTLPTSFYEAELDYFGNHMFDKIGDDPKGLPEEGKHTFEWKAA